jgi:hypothetical protein
VRVEDVREAGGGDPDVRGELRPAQIVPVRSGVIPPGGTYTYTPDTVASITYHSGRRPTLEGKLQASWSSSDEAGANSGG